jgi:hypothetical protein
LAATSASTLDILSIRAGLSQHRSKPARVA